MFDTTVKQMHIYVQKILVTFKMLRNWYRILSLKQLIFSSLNYDVISISDKVPNVSIVDVSIGCVYQLFSLAIEISAIKVGVARRVSLTSEQ